VRHLEWACEKQLSSESFKTVKVLSGVFKLVELSLCCLKLAFLSLEIRSCIFDQLILSIGILDE